jgi:hypothetical protein
MAVLLYSEGCNLKLGLLCSTNLEVNLCWPNIQLNSSYGQMKNYLYNKGECFSYNSSTNMYLNHIQQSYDHSIQVISTTRS